MALAPRDGSFEGGWLHFLERGALKKRTCPLFFFAEGVARDVFLHGLGVSSALHFLPETDVDETTTVTTTTYDSYA